MGKGGIFTTRYKCHQLVYFDVTDAISVAIACEKKIKAGSRAQKIELINEANPQWMDLAADWF